MGPADPSGEKNGKAGGADTFAGEGGDRWEEVGAPEAVEGKRERWGGAKQMTPEVL